MSSINTNGVIVHSDNTAYTIEADNPYLPSEISCTSNDLEVLVTNVACHH